MFRKNQILYMISRQISSKGKSNIKKIRMVKPPDIETIQDDPEITSGYLARTIGSNNRKWQIILEKYPELISLKRKDVVNSMEMLKSLEYNVDDILSKPMILYSNALTLENRFKVFKECGIEDISIGFLFKYVTVMNKSVNILKAQGYIDFDIDVTERLRTTFTDLDLEILSNYPSSEIMSLKAIRQNILNSYLVQRLDMSVSNIEKLWKVYSRVKHKSFESVQSMVDILVNELNFSKERISKNLYLLHGDCENVRRIIKEIPSIDGQDVREIMHRRPKILMSSCDSLSQTLEYVKSYGISENAVLRCLEVLTLGSETVLERLKDLNSVEQFQVLTTNPRVLRLVHYQNKARLRLEYLNQLKVRCASLHILSCDSEAFAKFARDGSDRTKGRDIVVFLGNVLNKDESDLRNLFSRHPNWCHIPVIHIKQCYEFLKSKKFPNEDIFKNIHLLLYPIQRIQEKLQLIHSSSFLEDINLNININTLSNEKLLTLILYLIENEFHFTGDGIWTEHHIQHVENFNNLLPDFPQSLNKIYKYGTKEPEKRETGQFL